MSDSGGSGCKTDPIYRIWDLIHVVLHRHMLGHDIRRYTTGGAHSYQRPTSSGRQTNDTDSQSVPRAMRDYQQPNSSHAGEGGRQVEENGVTLVQIRVEDKGNDMTPSSNGGSTTSHEIRYSKRDDE